MRLAHATPTRPTKFLVLVAGLSAMVFLIGCTFGVLATERIWVIVGITLQSLGAAILFPVIVSFLYDRMRENWFGDEVWRIFTELADAGIQRIYQHREASTRSDNAQVRLLRELESVEEGEVLMLGPTLRVFFNPLGPFFPAIAAMCSSPARGVQIRALVSNPDSESALHREQAEQSLLAEQGSSQYRRDVDSSVATVKKLARDSGGAVQLRNFIPAPYCTVVIFAHCAYYSPNLLSGLVPVRLPMIIFRAGSHGYRVVRDSFEHYWSRPDTNTLIGE